MIYTMLLFKRVEDLQNHIQQLKDKGHTIGFAPTMGALHSGHLSLIQLSKTQTDYTVCSIFVNPTQFNEQSDLDKYPRTIGADIDLLTSVDNDILFLPAVEEIYPSNTTIRSDFDFGQLEEVMEGAFRPGHFKGMAQVVNRLLEIVQPDKLFMGQKDFQQLTIVRDMLKQTGMKTELVMCPIIREDDGLAKSSRNVRLLPDIRKRAIILSQTLQEAKSKLSAIAIETIEQQAMEALSLPHFKPEYFSIVDGITLQAVENEADHTFIVACTAVWAGDVRLIDNMILKNELADVN